MTSGGVGAGSLRRRGMCLLGEQSFRLTDFVLEDGDRFFQPCALRFEPRDLGAYLVAFLLEKVLEVGVSSHRRFFLAAAGR
jgi:hypothetical protein